MKTILALKEVDLLIKHAPYAVISMNEKHEITIFNPVAEDMFGYTQDEVLGKRIECLMPREAAKTHESHVKNFDKQKIDRKSMNDRAAIHGKRKDNTIFPIRAGISKIIHESKNHYIAFIEDVTDIIEKEHELQLIIKELNKKNREITDSIEYAKRLQLAILPSDKLVKTWLKDSFIVYKPKDILAGDFYWMENTEDKILFGVADCTGHGVPGAMVSVICNNALNRAFLEFNLTNPGEILDKTRDLVIEDFERSGEKEINDGMDIALCSLSGNKLYYSGAYNPLWIIREKTDIIEEIKADSQPIGKFEKNINYKTNEITLKEGDCFYIFSDGFQDQFGGENDKKFMKKNVKKLLLSIQDKSMANQRLHIIETFENWKGNNEQVDDVCMIGVRFHEKT